MKLIKNFAITVASLIGDMWLGLGIKPEVYDKRSSMKTNVGYILFILLAASVAITSVVWLCLRIY
ncbi:hypothetical protein SY83_05660 [Paenibacillus swuensis]|uniref:Uncharacterized protein n=1 Tax=Paenibacillus swuensis TaxID=1178515 RepID=A0A172TPA6_9BACL|nr:hypothetical protein [Paenibacillus swuensis]ANE48744.1 hypothetical protein SY83_05660 [Paenibacillus swuensis]